MIGPEDLVRQGLECRELWETAEVYMREKAEYRDLTHEAYDGWAYHKQTIELFGVCTRRWRR